MAIFRLLSMMTVSVKFLKNEKRNRCEETKKSSSSTRLPEIVELLSSRRRKMIDGNLKCCLPSEWKEMRKGKESIRVVSLLFLFLLLPLLLTYQMMMSYCDAET